MKNLSSINHNQFSRLFEITQSYNKATLLDKLVYWWQISTFTIPNDPHIWFTRSREQIAKESKLSLRTVDRYLDEFSKKGLIEKTNRLLIKKHLYIRITDTLLLVLGMKNEKTIHTKEKIKPSSTASAPKQADVNKKVISTNLAHFGSIDIAKMAIPIYKDQNNNLNNNTVTKNDNVSNSKNKNPIKNSDIQQNINNEHLSPQLTNYIKGVINNLKNQHNLKTSSPKQLYSEIVYSLMNKSHQFVGIEDNIHRINIIAKLLRENRWRTPKGFFSYSSAKDINKQSMPVKECQWKNINMRKKDTNTSHLNYENNLHTVRLKNIQQDIQEINRLLHTETCYYNDLKQQHEKKPSQVTQAAILSINRKISALINEKILLQEKLDQTNAA